MPGPTFKAKTVDYAVDDRQVQLTLDIAGAYPPQAHLKTWQRTVTLRRSEAVTISDDYELTQPVGEIVASIVTPCTVVVEEGTIHFVERPILPDRRSGAGQLRYDGRLFTVHTETIPITDERLGGTWGESLTRVVFATRQPPLRNQWEWRFVPG